MFLKLFMCLSFCMTIILVTANPDTPPGKCRYTSPIQEDKKPTPPSTEYCWAKVDGMWVKEGRTNNCEAFTEHTSFCYAYACESGDGCHFGTNAPVEP